MKAKEKHICLRIRKTHKKTKTTTTKKQKEEKIQEEKTRRENKGI